MKVRQVVSMAAWAALVVFMLPMAASNASADESDATPLEGNQCWGRCSTCVTRCVAVHGADQERCTRTCQAGNDRCCEASGRNGSSRVCGCY